MSLLSPVVNAPAPAPESQVARFRAIYDDSYNDLVRYLRRRVATADVGDALNEIYLTAWRRFDSIPSDDADPTSTGPARLWLFGVARKVVANQYRSRDRRDRLDVRLAGQPAKVAGSGPDRRAADETGVIEALATLSDNDAELLRLVAWEGLNNDEAAVVLECTANAVAIRMHRARARLAEALAAQVRSAPPRPNDPAPSPPRKERS